VERIIFPCPLIFRSDVYTILMQSQLAARGPGELGQEGETMTTTHISDLMREIDGLIRDATIAQRQAAMRELLADDLAADWFSEFPNSVGARKTKSSIENGSVCFWLHDQIDRISTCGTWQQRGAGALNHSNRPDGKPVSDAEMAIRIPAAIGVLESAIKALKNAGVVYTGPDETDKAFAACGGSVSYL
jgi:hypothetical protein